MQEKYTPEEIEVAAQAHWNKTHAARAIEDASRPRSVMNTGPLFAARFASLAP